jgi:glucuronokinase
MVQAARDAGATAKFAGSGGSIIGTYRDEAHYQKLRAALAELDVRVFKPRL